MDSFADHWDFRRQSFDDWARYTPTATASTLALVARRRR
jgi:hypothetical protein